MNFNLVEKKENLAKVAPRRFGVTLTQKPRLIPGSKEESC